ncbi:MAG: WbqC family protein [Rhodospirillaceae bacterium]|nr:WbqC family protein [Rhodospirillaceae bacterium]MDD9918705.1 WbqC family protein [Rhodospirillaceae bacterium]MDD9927210.1 WbqC family protein [Rhodospirillaceae bacterium]
MLVAIHQPNYAPWIGYFRKIARASHFVFLDDAAFSKGGVINRVRILDGGEPAWLTVPAKPSLGTPIAAVVAGQSDWPKRHLSRLYNTYRGAAAFSRIWPDVERLYDAVSAERLAAANRRIIEDICAFLEIETVFHNASEFATAQTGDDRLIALVQAVPGATGYLSGQGGRKYQDETKFAAAGLSLDYSDYDPVPYPQTSPGFTPGLSILDAAFNLGWDGAAALVTGDIGSN